MTTIKPKTFFTSDEHYGHVNIIKYSNRPFANVEEMNQGLIDRHNAVVTKDDLVYHIGDFSMSEKLVPIILPQLNGTHYLILGNHDTPHPLNKKRSDVAWSRYRDYGFKEVYLELKLGPFVLNHLPYPNKDKPEDRFFKHSPKDEGGFLLHGHVHEAWKSKDKMINVGVDVWNYAPVQYEILLDLAGMIAGTKIE